MSRASARPLRGLDQRRIVESGFFFFNDTAPTEIYTLSLHDALPISYLLGQEEYADRESYPFPSLVLLDLDRKSTRLNSSHRCISYAVFCLKKNHGLNAWQYPAGCPARTALRCCAAPARRARRPTSATSGTLTWTKWGYASAGLFFMNTRPTEPSPFPRPPPSPI